MTGTKLILLAVALAASASISTAAAAGSPITFSDVAANGGAGISYRRTASDRYAVIEGYLSAGQMAADAVPMSPLKSRGAPGVALLDYDRDGYLDIYVTNGPGQANSLYQNQFATTGIVEFVDRAVAAGVAATASDGTGTCFGDIDNDGDEDLLVLAYNAAHSLYQNQGDGTFADISAASGLTYGQGAVSCAMGDINGDGLLDIAIANASSFDDLLALAVEPFDFNTPNQLFLNAGGNRFHDISETSGMQDLAGIPAGKATISWAVSIVDIDLDGDQDILLADDQTGLPNTAQGGVDRGFIQVLENDGAANFTARTATGTGLWMGLAINDLNCDGYLDIFGSNFGDYGLSLFDPNYQLGAAASRWLLGRADGSFDDPGVGGLVSTPFGWGASTLDYDNDGDPDLLFHGGMDLITAVDQTNAGALLRNDGCSATFARDTHALAHSADHGKRTVQGTAVGDLNNDGFVDVVTVSSGNIPDGAPEVAYPVSYGSSFDVDANFLPLFLPIDATTLGWTGVETEEGTLTVEINSASNGNRWAAFDLIGSVGIIAGASVNRDGIGAVVSFTPNRGDTATQPVLGGSSYASQDSLTANFGLGDSRAGTIEVLWPGGVRNRLYNVHAGERLVLPEIPCSFDAQWPSLAAYRRCVRDAVSTLTDANLINAHEGARLRASASRAYHSRR